VISKISNSARKNIETLDIKVQEKIISRLEHLQENPFGGEVRKVQGKKNIFREKVDAYSGGFRPGIPTEAGHPFRRKAAMYSDVKPATFWGGIGKGGRNQAE